MKFNTSNIIGRNLEIKNISQSLINQSVVLSAHRRMGKTSLLKKLTEKSTEFTNYVLLIEEGTKSPEEFVYNLYNRLQEEKLITVEKGKKFREWLGKTLDGTAIKEIKLPSFRPYWKDALRNIIGDLIDEQEGKNTIIMIDEFPIMLYKFIIEYKLVNEAIELIDTLREIRQIYGDRGIKFIYCGSIGINVVIEKLKELHDYAGEPINDMRVEILDAMFIEDARELVKHLAKTNEIRISQNIEETIEFLCKSVDCLPFYIDLLIKEITLKHDEISLNTISKELNNLIETAGNQGQFNHYTQRISTYYENSVARNSKTILDWLSNKVEFIEERDIINMLSQKQKVDEEDVKILLKKLFDDLYLNREILEGRRLYRFKYELLRKWWSINFG